MRRSFRSSMIAALMIAALALGFARGASASPLSQSFPVTKQPTSAHFDINGSISAGGTQLEYIGDGAFVGTDRVEENISLSAPAAPGSPAAPAAISISVKIVGTKEYIKLLGLGGENDNKWYVADVAAMGGMQGGITGLSGSGSTGIDPKYADALSTQPMGTEIVNGVSTTKYQTDVDLQKLYNILGLGNQVPADFARNSTMMLLTWIGTDDQYVYKMSIVLNGNLSTEGSPSNNIAVELTYTFKDFDTAITIEEPTGAEPLTLPQTSGSASPLSLGIPAALLTGISSSVPAMPSPAPVTAPTGMPRTGSPDGATLPLPLFALATLCLCAGLTLRRRAPAD